MRSSDYKKLQVWQKAMHLTGRIYDCTATFPKTEEYRLKSQMCRAVVSAPSNIAEGSQRGTDKDFAKFILIAKGSLAELETQILIAQHLEYINEEETNSLLRDIQELQKMLYSFHLKLKAES